VAIVVVALVAALIVIVLVVAARRRSTDTVATFQRQIDALSSEARRPVVDQVTQLERDDEEATPPPEGPEAGIDAGTDAGGTVHQGTTEQSTSEQSTSEQGEQGTRDPGEGREDGDEREEPRHGS
jgi:hypothetical protein